MGTPVSSRVIGNRKPVKLRPTQIPVRPLKPAEARLRLELEAEMHRAKDWLVEARLHEQRVLSVAPQLTARIDGRGPLADRTPRY